MTKVRIVSGGYGAHENGRVKLYRRGQEVEVSQEEAERLVKAGDFKKAKLVYNKAALAFEKVYEKANGK